MLMCNPVELQVCGISDFEWNKEGFDLVVDPPVKELITALVTSQLASEKATELVDGKVIGLLVLLHGYVLFRAPKSKVC